MRRFWLAACLLGLVGCSGDSGGDTTIKIVGPFGKCPILILPGGQTIDAGSADFSSQTGTVTLGTTTYTINNNCQLVTVSTTNTVNNPPAATP